MYTQKQILVHSLNILALNHNCVVHTSSCAHKFEYLEVKKTHKQACLYNLTVHLNIWDLTPSSARESMQPFSPSYSECTMNTMKPLKV